MLVSSPIHRSPLVQVYWFARYRPVVLGSLWSVVEEPPEAHLGSLAFEPLVPYVTAYLLGLPAEAVAVDDRRPQTGAPEEALLDAGELHEESPAGQSLELFGDLVGAQGYPHPADIHVDVVPVIAMLGYFNAYAGCCLQQQLRAPGLELRNVKDIVAILRLEAHVSFDAENA